MYLHQKYILDKLSSSLIVFNEEVDKRELNASQRFHSNIEK